MSVRATINTAQLNNGMPTKASMLPMMTNAPMAVPNAVSTMTRHGVNGPP